MSSGDRWVTLCVVPLFEGPLLVSRLQARGIDAVGQESVNLVTRSATDYRIVVREHEVDVARSLLNEGLNAGSA